MAFVLVICNQSSFCDQRLDKLDKSIMFVRRSSDKLREKGPLIIRGNNQL